MPNIGATTVGERWSHYLLNKEHGIRGIVRLTNGWIIAMVHGTVGSSIRLYFYVSKDDGASFTQLCHYQNTSTALSHTNTIATLSSVGTTVYLATAEFWVSGGNGAPIFFTKFDATTVGNVNVYEMSIQASYDGSYMHEGLSMAVRHSDGEIAIAWAGRSSTPDNLRNSSNVKVIKSVNGGSSWTKMDGTSGRDYITQDNDTSLYSYYPSITYANNGNLVCAFAHFDLRVANQYYIGKAIWNGSSWTVSRDQSGSIMSDTNYVQTAPQLVTAPNGRIWCVWAGWSSGFSASNIMARYSDNNGSTWVNGGVSGPFVTQIHRDQKAPSATIDHLGNLHVAYDSIKPSDSMVYHTIVSRIGNSWGTPINKGKGLGSTALYDPLFGTKFSTPLTLYRNDDNWIYFSGEWKAAPDVFVNIGGSWKQAESIHVNIGGVWKEVESLSVNIGGTWKEA